MRHFGRPDEMDIVVWIKSKLNILNLGFLIVEDCVQPKGLENHSWIFQLAAAGSHCSIDLQVIKPEIAASGQSAFYLVLDNRVGKGNSG